MTKNINPVISNALKTVLVLQGLSLIALLLLFVNVLPQILPIHNADIVGGVSIILGIIGIVFSIFGFILKADLRLTIPLLLLSILNLFAFMGLTALAFALADFAESQKIKP